MAGSPLYLSPEMVQGAVGLVRSQVSYVLLNFRGVAGADVELAFGSYALFGAAVVQPLQPLHKSGRRQKVPRPGGGRRAAARGAAAVGPPRGEGLTWAGRPEVGPPWRE